jgi:SAM-dependent methyltransferase
VDWRVGDGETLAGVDTASVDGVISHVVFQHLPDPAITYGYVEEMGRVLKPGGWAAFQVSDHPALHRREPLRRLLGRRLSGGPRGAGHPAWLGSAVDLDHLRAVAAEAGLSVERILGEGSQYCLVLLRRGG